MTRKTIREIPHNIQLDPPVGVTVTASRLELWAIPCPCGVCDLVHGDDPPEVYTCIACGRQNKVARVETE